MRNLSKVTTLITTLLMSAQSFANEQVRLILSQPISDKSTASTKSTKANLKSCLETPNGAGMWCLPIASKSGLTKRKTSSNKTPRYDIKVVTLDTFGYSEQVIVNLLNTDGRFGHVEVDVIVKSTSDDGSYGSQALPLLDSLKEVYNDSDVTEQVFLGSVTESPVGMGVAQVKSRRDLVEQRDNAIDVVIIDGSFYEHQDFMGYTSGTSTATIGLEEGYSWAIPSDDHSPTPYEVDNCATSHGLSVASHIAAKTDNELMIAGMTNNVKIHAIRAMACGLGYNSDIINGIKWLLGDEISGEVPTYSDIDYKEVLGVDSYRLKPYTGGVGVINLSLGSYGACGQAMQNVLNRAKEAGWLITAATGNDGRDALAHTPSNCEHVYAVGAVASNGELWSYSNNGIGNDFVANGVEAEALNKNGTLSYAGGTSNAAPMLAGVLAIARAETELDNEELDLALRLTSKLSQLDGNTCEGSCGYGVPNINDLIEFEQAVNESTFNQAKHGLAQYAENEQSWYIEHFGDQVPMCEQVELNFMGGYENPLLTFQLVSTPIGTEWNTSSNQVVKTYEHSFTYETEPFIQDEVKYGIKVCDLRTKSCTNVFEMDTSLLANMTIPQVCNS